jgi:hypothetical protein
MTDAKSPSARRACAVGLITLCLATLSPALAGAQAVTAPPAGREAQLDAARARKAETLQPPARSRFEPISLHATPSACARRSWESRSSASA